jgi:hypothetical protein
MRKIFISLSALTLIFASCERKHPGTEYPDKDLPGREALVEVPKTHGDSVALKNFQHYETGFRDLIKTHKGLLRGIHIGDPKSKVMQMEDQANLIDQTDQMASYKIEGIENVYEASVVYGFKDDVVNTMNMYLTLTDDIQYEVYLEGFTEYFGHKFGLPKITEDKAEVWMIEHAPEHEIDIIDQVDGNSYKIEVDVR